MTSPPVSSARQRLGDLAPKLVDLTEQVLFGDVWERPQLSKRDRSLVTVAALVALNRTEQLPGHLRRAVDNGVTLGDDGRITFVAKVGTQRRVFRVDGTVTTQIASSTCAAALGCSSITRRKVVAASAYFLSSR